MNFTAYICFQFFLAELAELLLNSPQKFGRFPHISSRSRGPTPMPAISGVWVPWLVSCSLVSRLSSGWDPTRSPQEPASAWLGGWLGVGKWTVNPRNMIISSREHEPPTKWSYLIRKMMEMIIHRMDLELASFQTQVDGESPMMTWNYTLGYVYAFFSGFCQGCWLGRWGQDSCDIGVGTSIVYILHIYIHIHNIYIYIHNIYIYIHT